MSLRSALTPRVAARSRRIIIIGATTTALAIAIGGGASSAMAATDLGCLQFPKGQLCATDVGSPGSVSATAYFSDGSQQTIEQFPNDTWNTVVQAQAQVPEGNGMSALDEVLAHPPSSGSAGGNPLLMPDLTATVVGAAGAINDITPPGTTSQYDPLSGTTGTLADGNLTNG